MKSILLFSVIIIFSLNSGKCFSQSSVTNKIYHINSLSELDSKITELNTANESIVDVLPETQSQDKFIIITSKNQTGTAKYTDYKLIMEASPENLVKECKKALQDGYQLIGGISMSVVNTNMYCIQAVAK
jgi:hypothetical protein